MKHITDQEIIEALRASYGYSSNAAKRLGCSAGLIWDRIRTSPQVGKVYWGIRKVMKRKKAGDHGNAGKSSGKRWAKRPYYKTGMTYRERLRNRGHSRSDTPSPRVCLFDLDLLERD